MSTTDATASFTQRKGALAQVQSTLHRFPVISSGAVLVVACIVFTMQNSRFAGGYNIGIMLQQTAVMATLAVAQTLVILTAGVDLSVGTAMLLVSLIMAKLAVGHGWNPGVVMLIGLAIALAIGLAHGLLVTRMGLPPFIVTLGTFYIYLSLGNVYGEGKTFQGDAMPHALTWLHNTFSIGNVQITYAVVMALVMYLVFGFILAKTAWGRHVYATGDDKEAARLAGIDVDRVLVSVYLVAGLIYAIGAWVQIGRSYAASANGAADVNLESITAVVIGGTSLFGGRGRLWGTLVGAMIVTAFRQGLKLAGVDASWQTFAIGSLILGAVALDQWIRKIGK